MTLPTLSIAQSISLTHEKKGRAVRQLATGLEPVTVLIESLFNRYRARGPGQIGISNCLYCGSAAAPPEAPTYTAHSVELGHVPKMMTLDTASHAMQAVTSQ